MQEKTALVLGGGGARGAFEVGVIKALQEEEIKFDMVVGTSVGALNGVLFAMGSYDKMLSLWSNIETGMILSFEIPESLLSMKDMRKALQNLVIEAVKSNGVSAAPLYELVKEIVDEDKVRNSDILFGLTTTRMKWLEPVKLFVDEIPEGKLADFLVASASCYPGMQAHKIDGVDYIDGGYSDNVPIDMAAERGATRIIAVDLDSPGVVKKSTQKDITRIRSRHDLGTLLVFDPRRSYRNMRLGYLETKKAFSRLEGDLYTFYKGELDEETKRVAPKLFFLLEKLKLNIFLGESVLTLVEKIFRTEAKSLGMYIENDAYTVDMFVLTSAEILGEMLGVSPLRIYHFEDFKRAIVLCKQRGGMGVKESDHIPMSEVQVISEMTKGFQIIDKTRVFEVICTFLKQENFSDEDKRKAALWARLYTREFCAALYYTAME